jgi:hypothetical protein
MGSQKPPRPAVTETITWWADQQPLEARVAVVFTGF